ncbi:NUDIX hydrolase [Desulfogranum japonicum]|uniref:NUDIX hydrolase n=1 Tax=Desulfogranum japonicum TaxID=231447 RepID=UPI00040E531A|nr:NUDIX hydrolase [Desulfogranum japonicum]
MITECYLYLCELSAKKLSDGEKRDGQRVGAYLAANGMVVSQVLYQDTPVYGELAKKLVKAMGQEPGLACRMNGSNGQCYTELLGAVAGSTASAGNILIIGSVAYLSPLIGQGKLLNCSIPATDVLMQWKNDDPDYMKNRWSPGLILKREKLPALFPYPSPDGSELRPRPAYYYTQSAVIPFQRTKKGLQVLVIGSSKRKHLVVPKGIHEPGLSARDSAAKESFEEAGVRGPVSEKPIGSYTYGKWGAICTVTVYVQEVSELVAAPLWQESHRGRQWMKPQRAAAAVKEAKLGKMMGRLQQFVHEEFA